MELSFVELAVVIGVAYAIGYRYRGVVMLRNMTANAENMIRLLGKLRELQIQEEEQADDPDREELIPEQVNGMWYVYTKHTKQFLSQGTTLDDALAEVGKRFPDRKFWCNKSKQDSQSA